MACLLRFGTLAPICLVKPYPGSCRVQSVSNFVITGMPNDALWVLFCVGSMEPSVGSDRPLATQNGNGRRSMHRGGVARWPQYLPPSRCLGQPGDPGVRSPGKQKYAGWYREDRQRDSLVSLPVRLHKSVACSASIDIPTLTSQFRARLTATGENPWSVAQIMRRPRRRDLAQDFGYP